MLNRCVLCKQKQVANELSHQASYWPSWPLVGFRWSQVDHEGSRRSSDDGWGYVERSRGRNGQLLPDHRLANCSRGAQVSEWRGSRRLEDQTTGVGDNGNHIIIALGNGRQEMEGTVMEEGNEMVWMLWLASKGKVRKLAFLFQIDIFSYFFSYAEVPLDTLLS